MRAGPVGIIANPASGKDIRRVIARASVFDNQEKQNIMRRVLAGAIAAGATDFLYMPDGYGIVSEAAGELAGEASFRQVESPHTESALDTVRAARQFREAGCAVVVTLGGDGTNRAVTLGWRDVPIVAISTGTNNVFPRLIEATVAGAAAGLIGSGQVDIEAASRRAKIVTATIEGERDDLALIDAVVLDEQFVGARAIWEPSRLRLALLARAEPAAVGVSAIGGLVRPLGEEADGGLLIEFGGDRGVYAPIAPGLYRDVPVRAAKTLPEGTPVEASGPGVLALDGERERVLKPGQRVSLRVERSGPRVVDVERTLQIAACRGLFRFGGEEERADGD